MEVEECRVKNHRCKHDFQEISRRKYVDFLGNFVLAIYYQCSACGKKIKKKFWMRGNYANP